jgi:hypothetical protein
MSNDGNDDDDGHGADALSAINSSSSSGTDAGVAGCDASGDGDERVAACVDHGEGGASGEGAVSREALAPQDHPRGGRRGSDPRPLDGRARLLRLMEALPGGASGSGRTVDLDVRVELTDATVRVLGLSESPHAAHTCAVVELGTVSSVYSRSTGSNNVTTQFDLGDLIVRVDQMPAEREHHHHERSGPITILQNDGLGLERLSVKASVDPTVTLAELERRMPKRRRLCDIDLDVVVVGLHLTATPPLLRFAGSLGLGGSVAPGTGGGDGGGAAGAAAAAPPPSARQTDEPTMEGDGMAQPLAIIAKVQMLNSNVLCIGASAPGSVGFQLGVDSWLGTLNRSVTPIRVPRSMCVPVSTAQRLFFFFFFCPSALHKLLFCLPIKTKFNLCSADGYTNGICPLSALHNTLLQSRSAQFGAVCSLKPAV